MDPLTHRQKEYNSVRAVHFFWANNLLICLPFIGGNGSSSLLALLINLDEPCCLRIFFDFITCRWVNGSIDRLDVGIKWLDDDDDDGDEVDDGLDDEFCCVAERKLAEPLPAAFADDEVGIISFGGPGYTRCLLLFLQLVLLFTRSWSLLFVDYIFVYVFTRLKNCELLLFDSCVFVTLSTPHVS